MPAVDHASISVKNIPTTPDAATPEKLNTILPWMLLLTGVLAMYLPSFWDLFHGVWASDEQGHGPIVLGLSIWLIYRKWPEIIELPQPGKPSIVAWALLIFGCLVYIIGRSQDVPIFEVGSLIVVALAATILMRGWAGAKLLWFCLFFMLFMIPLPGLIVDAMTQPLKMAVSYVAELILSAAGYPISRTGVMLQIGQYQLLVADACAGLHTLFTLEALGLLYLNVVQHSSAIRNIILAILIIPISFSANVIRVMTLTLITYHLGDEAGQGFLHGFSGMVLFLSALLLIIGTDSVLRIGAHQIHRSQAAKS
jgi:exosortase B